MMPQPATRSDREDYDGLRLCSGPGDEGERVRQRHQRRHRWNVSLRLAAALSACQLQRCHHLIEHMRYAVTDPKEFATQLFKAGQQPAAWLRSAGHSSEVQVLHPT
jgi:hypothetical protein